MARQMIRVRPPNFTPLRAEAKRFRDAHHRAALLATDEAIQRAARRVKARMRGAGLGRLDRAVGVTSAYRKGQRSTANGRPYGVIFAKGGDESRAGGALEAYSRGTTIRATNGEWLAIPTAAVPRMMTVDGRRRRTTPAAYNRSGFAASIGKLVFRKVKPNLALLVLRKVSISPKTGQARALGKRAPRTRIVPDKDVVAFILIKQTRRAKRFDKDVEIAAEARRVADYIGRILKRDYR